MKAFQGVFGKKIRIHRKGESLLSLYLIDHVQGLIQAFILPAVVPWPVLPGKSFPWPEPKHEPK